MAKIISYTIFILLFVTGCSTDETEYFPEDNVLVEVKAPQTDGWSTKDYINTRNYPEKTTVRKEEDGLKIPCCNNCHNIGDVLTRIHGNPMAEMMGQLAWEKRAVAGGKTEKEAREAFRSRYGISYL